MRTEGVFGDVRMQRLNAPNYHNSKWLYGKLHRCPLNWARSTQTMRLRHIDNLYDHAHRLFKANALDDALSGLDDVKLADILESWFMSLRNQSVVTRSNEDRWQTGLGFVTSVVTWLSQSSDSQIWSIEARIHRLTTLYRQLHIHRGPRSEAIRSLPSSVVESLYQILDPESDSNPFVRAHMRRRVFIVFVLMLHQGLRRGELLLKEICALIEDAENRVEIIENREPPFGLGHIGPRDPFPLPSSICAIPQGNATRAHRESVRIVFGVCRRAQVITAKAWPSSANAWAFFESNAGGLRNVWPTWLAFICQTFKQLRMATPRLPLDAMRPSSERWILIGTLISGSRECLPAHPPRLESTPTSELITLSRLAASQPLPPPRGETRLERRTTTRSLNGNSLRGS